METVLLVCGHAEIAEGVLAKLHAAGLGVVGPAPTAGIALALAAQTQPTLALVASPPTGRRDAQALGAALMDTWGVPTWILGGDAASDSRSWAPGLPAIDRLRLALTDVVDAA